MNLLMTELPPEEVPINSLMSELQFPPLPHESSFSEVTCNCELELLEQHGSAIEVNSLMTGLPSELEFPPLPHESKFSDVACSSKLCNCLGEETSPVPVFFGGSQEVLPGAMPHIIRWPEYYRGIPNGLCVEELNAASLGISELPGPDILSQQGYCYVPADVVKSLGKPAAHAKIQTEIQKMDPSEFVVHIFQDPPRGCASKMGGK